MTERSMWRPAAAEFLGVFALVFVGAGSIVTLGRLVAGPDPAVVVGVALAHGLTIAVMITAMGHLSGGHFNPAVTIAAMTTRRISVPLGGMYIAAQLLGGAAGAYLLVASLPADWWQAAALGTPSVAAGLDPMKAVFAEAVLTFFLVLVILGAAMDQRHPNWGVAGFAIGLTVTLDILMGAPLTGAAMNPARAFGTALAASSWELHYVYWVGPILGGVIAGLVYDAAFVENKVKPSKIPPAEAPKPAMPETPPAEPMPPAEPPASQG